MVPSPSPARSPLAPTPQADDGHFPRGQCRYILMVPDLKGQRCGCVTFSHNTSLPGASCECGHLACFHLNSSDGPPSGQNRDELEVIKQKMNVLEQQAGLWGQQHGGLDAVVGRLSQLEEVVDKDREEFQSEVKGSYSNISAAWRLVEQMQKKMASFEEVQRTQSEQLARANQELQDLRNRQLELCDSEDSLEERIEKLENSEQPLSPVPQLASRVPPVLEPTPTAKALQWQQPGTGLASPARHSPESSAGHHEPHPSPLPSPLTTSERPRPLDPGVTWTVHVSVLPSNDRPFPFEKDTSAYKRCLSRGLQQMIAVQGTDSQSFRMAVSHAFQHVLGGRAWEPLRAEICHAQKLEGFPMLQRLDPEQKREDYNMMFLQERCAVCDASGRISSMYVAPSEGIISWDDIRRLPVFVEGLEASWEHDKYLDDQDSDTSEEQELELELVYGSKADDLAASPTRALKRGTAMMSQSNVLATGGVPTSEFEGPRAKMARTRMTGVVGV